jgi:protein-tyrosine phosphatase
VHCTKGKDRTGLACILILLALGADEETTLQDYLRSNEYREAEIQNRLSEGRTIAPEDEGYMTLMYLREGVREQLGRDILAAIRERSGTIERYMSEEYGWDDTDLNAYRNHYLE